MFKRTVLAVALMATATAYAATSTSIRFMSRDGDAPPRSFAKPHKMARSRPADSPHPMTKPSFKKKKVHRKGNGDHYSEHGNTTIP